MVRTSYALGLGSNRRGEAGAPARVLDAAVRALADAGLTVGARSRTRATAAVGGAGRAFANAAVVVETHLAPPALLALIKRIERDFGRRPGRRWGPRVLDIDILLWSGGIYRSVKRGSSLSIPHSELPRRAFALRPLIDVAPGWRHPRLGAKIVWLSARLRRPRPVDRLRRAS